MSQNNSEGKLLSPSGKFLSAELQAKIISRPTNTIEIDKFNAYKKIITNVSILPSTFDG